ncbi:MAG: hypothetical protein V4677_09115 [Bacteroidota bacterium]
MANITEVDFIEKLTKLRSLVFQFDKNFDEEKHQLLKELSPLSLYKPQTFQQFHQVLMAMMAYPSNKDLFELTKNTLQKLLVQLEKRSTLPDKLSGTGLLHTAVECNFSFTKVSYITQKFPGQVSIHSASSSIETQKSVLKLLLPYVEYSKIHEGEKDLKNRLSQFNTSKTITDLEWLLQLIKQSDFDSKTQNIIYNQLGIFVQWKVSDQDNSVSFLRGTDLPIYYHTKPLEKKTSLPEIIQQKLPQPVKLTDKDKARIIDAAKMTLFYLYRETEPFTNANKDDITLFQLDKGISIALFGSTVDKRYSLESYIGYMVFKNNVPASYGGGWIFGERSQFGINILESFRGGESGLIICELLRVYHQYFGATRFVVKPYQFGLHNMEAIKTGAFWFYYKLGFRPEDEKLRELALKEEKQKLVDPKYKSEVATLKKYTKSNLALTLTETSYPNYDPEKLSQRITNYINHFFNGDRQKAVAVCFKQLKQNTGIDTKSWKAEDIEYAKQIAILFSIQPNCREWQDKHKKDIELFIQLKSAKTEQPWIKHLQKFKAFWKYMNL